ncbi:PREDICTED: glutamate-rich WD repeat-containing protein 1 [Ceratosolen solmsi marchali]|uniref:Glutamate-rich WD repeat-containing protein 1 n=1 Tax=Ceratosolen solmsi marchali TaxID=326594 RepID=A0AAJ6YW89_9HYME|nr:PREDICTED: glutamate-rich WD repeat-containing protein 1 [Ceratosolen solmsi marchali]XP_011505508.1 PREDICTED: glutamate-rich WD repeat-containing protein 1 [Ceratosolen solmsi marchali]
MSEVDQMEDNEIEDDCVSSSDQSDDSMVEDKTKTKKVFLPGTKMESGEELVMDESAYRIFHQAQTGAPCLSFDIIKDDLGNSRETYPLTMYLVTGTQATKAHVNNLLVIKMSNLHGTKIKDNSEDESSDSEEEDEIKSPAMSVASIKHQGCVNRVRCTQIGSTVLAASWSELGRVTLWDLKEQLKAVESSAYLSTYQKTHQKSENAVKPVFTFKGHLSEGYGLDWCTTEIGTLASGDCKGNIHIWRYSDSGGSQTWHIDQRPYNSHAPHSVEDLQWSPNERHVLASCSVDKSIKIWDTRVNPQSSCMLTATDAHSTDVNVISWNKKETQFLLSGGDDGIIRVWDLRQLSTDGASPVATFKQHLAPVTSVEWHPDEPTVFASSGADNQITQWDLSVEADQCEENEDDNLAKLPPQLLFIHQGQTDVKELHWHPQCPGTIVSTALSGFNIFRTISV